MAGNSKGATKEQRGSKGIAPTSLNLNISHSWVVKTTPWLVCKTENLLPHQGSNLQPSSL